MGDPNPRPSDKRKKKAQLLDELSKLRKDLSHIIHALKLPLALLDGLFERSAELARDLSPDTPLRMHHDGLEDAIRCLRLCIESARLLYTKAEPLRRNLFNTLLEVLNGAAPPGSFVLSPDCSSDDCHAEIDKERLRVALTELIFNSRKYRHPGRVLSITLRWEIYRDNPDGEDWIRLTYCDNGYGFNDEERQQLFPPERKGALPFQRGELKPGTGLGLSYVQQVFVEHGGRIAEIGLGSEFGACFLIEFPRFQQKNGVL
jgi:signal transduction histidine kinase